MELLKAFESYHATQESEPKLKEYFVETDVLKKIKDSSKVCVVSGLKGTGKTAIYRDLTEFDQNADLIIGITTSNFSLSLPKQNLRTLTYANEFEYEICIEFFEQIMENSKLKRKIGNPLQKELKQHLDTFKENLKDIGQRFTGISILGCGFNLSDKKEKTLTGFLGKVVENRAISTLKKILGKELKLRLVIDDPEEVFFSTATIDEKLLGGLWLAAARINSFSENMRIIILMKSHIHDFVSNRTADLDKYPHSHIAICWDIKSLVALIKRRLIYFLKVSDSNWEDKLWGQSINSSEIQNSYSFILENVRNGPRELLTWIYLALEFNKNKEMETLDINSLKKTKSILSKKSFDTFNASHGEEFPDIGGVVQLIFEKIKAKKINKAEITNRVRDLQSSNRDFQNLSSKHRWIQRTVSTEFVEILFRVGAINIFLENEIYPYMCEYTNDNFEMAKKIRLTPIFHEYIKNKN